jgi:ferredoxin like protein
MSDKPVQPLDPALRDSLVPVNIDDMIASVKYYVDEDTSHLWIKDATVCARCELKPCLYFCPVEVYKLDRAGRTMVGYQACVECGSCRVGCPFANIGWQLPRGGYGVAYKFG